MHPRNLRSVLVKIESFHIEPWSPSHSIASFSPTTYRISDLGRDQLRILDACQSEYNPLATAASLPMGVSSQLTHSETSISGNTPPVVYVYPAEGIPTSEHGPHPPLPSSIFTDLVVNLGPYRRRPRSVAFEWPPYRCSP